MDDVEQMNFRDLMVRREHQWYAPGQDPEHTAQMCKSQIVEAQAGVPGWQCCTSWQRKLANKLNARHFVIEHGVRVADRYWSGREISELHFDRLPAQYVIRPNIGTQGANVFVVDNGYELFSQQQVSAYDLCEKMSVVVEADERIHFMVEQFVRNEEGQYTLPVEYQFYMFREQIALIGVIHRRVPNSLTQDRFYRPDFRPTEDIIRSYYPDKADVVSAPACFDEMREQAKILGKAYNSFVRIDLFATDQGSVFCEFAATPNMGTGYTDYADKMLCGLWQQYLGDAI